MKNKEKSEKKPKHNTPDNDNLSASRIAGLLDFYSDRAVAHASFFVASIFGLVTILNVIQELEEESVLILWQPVALFWLSVPLFFAFSYMGYFTLNRFSYFAEISDKLTLGLNSALGKIKVDLKEGSKTKRITLKEYVDRKYKKQEKLLAPKKIIARFARRSGLIWFASYWIGTTYLGSLAYSKFWNSWLDGISWILILLIFIFLIVALPQLYYNVKR